MKNLVDIENQALDAFNEGDFKRAKKTYYKLIELSPKNPRYFTYLGECHQRLGERQLAENCKNRAKDLTPSSETTPKTVLNEPDVSSAPHLEQQQAQPNSDSEKTKRRPESFGNKFGQIQSASKLFSEANEYWRQRQGFILKNDDRRAKEACLEVIRLCQLSVQKYEMEGDAYVLLSNALSSEESFGVGRLDQDRYEFLQSRSAAVIQHWYTLPHRDYPTTKNTAIGEQLWRMMVDEIKKDKAVSEDVAIDLMETYKNRVAAETISPESFGKIKTMVLRTPSASRVEQQGFERLSETHPSITNKEKTAPTQKNQDSTLPQAQNKFIEKYDRALLQDINELEAKVLQNEENEKQFMRSMGALESTIKEVVANARRKGDPLSQAEGGRELLNHANFLRKLG